jgi:hypothetical protein
VDFLSLQIDPIKKGLVIAWSPESFKNRSKFGFFATIGDYFPLENPPEPA